MGITHATTATGTDAGTGEIHKAQWNADHLVSGVANSGALVLLEQHTASSSSSLDFTTFISSDYDEYLFEIIDLLPATDNSNLLMRFGTGGGPTYDTSNHSADGFVYRNGASGTWGGTAISGVELNDPGGGIGTATANDAFNGRVALFNPQGSHWKRVQAQTSCRNSFGPSRVGFQIRGAYESTTVVTAIRFIMDTGNISSGTIRAYGVAKATVTGLVAPSYLGYNTVGGSTESMTAQRMYAKQITAGSNGNVLLGVQAYIDYTVEATSAFMIGLFADSGSDTIGDLITGMLTPNIVLAHGTGGGVSFPARWTAMPVTAALAASTKYWVGIEWALGSASPRLYYDGSGSDRYMPMGVTPYISDGAYTGVGTQTNSSRQYSIRALIL